MKFKKIISVLIIVAAVLQIFCLPAFAEGTYLCVTDYISVNSGKDVADGIQKLIDENPNRTLFFPDGEYLVSKPIYTPADPKKSVSLKLSDFAVIKASGEWKTGEAIIQLGGKNAYNTVSVAGSNYSLDGGIIDGSGIADGISINSGRETAVRNTSIKNTVTGLRIMYGANNGSSDADITGINISGNGKTEAVGIILEGYDNTLTNIRIGGVYTGVILRSGGNVLRNIHPLFGAYQSDFQGSCGFIEESGGNWFNYCYSDQFATGFKTVCNSDSVFSDCFCYWWNSTDSSYTYTGFKAEKKFNSNLSNFKMGGLTKGCKNVVLSVGKYGGNGVIDNLIIGNSDILTDSSYKAYEKSENIFDAISVLFWKCVLLVKTALI